VKQIIRHTTTYRYTAPVNYTIQLLRLTPRGDAHQRVLRWNIRAPGNVRRHRDAYGNVVHTLTLTRAHEGIVLDVRGDVLVEPLVDGCLPDDGGLPVQVYAMSTALTWPDEGVRRFTAEVVPQGLRNRADVLALAHAIHGAVTYVPGVTNVTTAAEEVLKLGRGVCQDHAHLYLACARGLGVPARYVSGYLFTEVEHAASHAWVDVWVEGRWVSVDVTNGQYASEQHCRLAVARDYDSASPVRGVRTGGGQESMTVDVEVQAGVQ
jgi:transglutaminase-like putative cysteine protease